jgi:phospholipid transport system substrate-binding protein
MQIARRKFMVAAAVSALAPLVLTNAALSSAAWASLPADAAKPVEELHAALLGAMQDGEALGFAGRLKALQPVLDQVFDIEGMAKMAFGPAWTALSPTEQTTAIDVFDRYIATMYASRFKSFSGQAFDTGKVTEHGADKAIVATNLTRPGKDPIALNYLVHDENGNWRIADVYLDGAISQLAQLRAEFSAPYRSGGFAGLQAALEDKIKQLGGGA